MKKKPFIRNDRSLSAAIALATLAANTTAIADGHGDTSIDEIVVTAELVAKPVMQLPNSVTVVDAEALRQRSAQHLEDALNLAPNVNFATGASRGRFIQIRGIGERSEFQEPIINSVGVLIDGIDFTGIATAATSLDVQQIEILRGPQGTLYGANALAGLINIVSNKPSDEFGGSFSIGVEEKGGREVSGVLNTPTGDIGALRLAVKNYQSDGFVENIFLGRDDTNNIDETSAKLSYRLNASDDTSVDITALFADIDNGYDAFSLDNTRQTYSDRPGVDTQETIAAAIKVDHQLSESLSLQASLSHADSELEYAYDEDWSHPGICVNTACDSSLFGFDWFYVSYDQYLRDNQNTAIDLRLTGSGERDWVVGVYWRDQQIDLVRNYTFNDGVFTSQLDTTNTAIYGQLTQPLSDKLSITGGLRFEQREQDYRDNAPAAANTDENLWGGRIALEYQANDDQLHYALISRGYKAGGFNLNQDIPADRREFDTETMLNFEVGSKVWLLDRDLQLQIALFYQDRNDVQTKESIVRSTATGVVGGTCPCSFTDLTGNAASGSNAGLELEARYTANDHISLYGSLGLLNAEFDEYLSFQHVDADEDNGVPFDLGGRDQTHSPRYQFLLGAIFAINDQLNIDASVEGKDEFFFSDRHQEKSDAYEIFNLSVNYQLNDWQFKLYGKNLTDEDIKTRGFGSFGNDPRKFYATEPYNQFGAGRLIGLSAAYQF